MSKHTRVGNKKSEVGKAGSPSSGTENEKRRDEKKKKRASMPKVSKKDVGGEKGGGLH